MSSDKTPGTPSGWKTPGDVMKLHRLKIKQKALNARLTRNTVGSSSTSQLPSKSIGEKTVNPFRRNSSSSNLNGSQSSNKRTRSELEDDDQTQDGLEGGSLFKMLGGNKISTTENVENISSFENILSKLSNPVQISSQGALSQGQSYKEVPIDWTLRYKMRFMSRKPFPWNQKLKTCEEASGITGFVRCLDSHTTSSSSTLDTSPNAQFLSTTMYWQHPHIPWLQLFPRSRLKPNSGQTLNSGSGSSLNSNSTTSSTVGGGTVLSQDMKTALHRDWVKSFMSLFHLLRAKQCPYFYLVSNSFTCLFRAAGVAGHSEIHAMLTPTTRGFRHLLRAEDIEFSMPLRKTDPTPSNSNTTNSTPSNPSAKRKKSSSPLGTNGVTDPTLEPLEQTQMETFSEDEEGDEEIEEHGTEDWLRDMI
uniref:Protein downstream neighbor of son homolog n=1 Tax=Cacopsylla melanoneura TaxID=428564 RepID=A0A8D9BZX8_9HEMI